MMRRVLLPAMLLVAAAGCSARVEQPVLAEFFHAARLRDRTALQKLSHVPFDPAVEGMVTEFTITRVVQNARGAGAARDVSIVAPVRALNGAVQNRAFVITIELVAGAWIVTAIRDAAASGP
jgi:hypothetical protein